MEPDTPRFWCRRCGKDVRPTASARLEATQAVAYSLRCHGEHEQARIRDEDLRLLTEKVPYRVFEPLPITLGDDAISVMHRLHHGAG